MTCPRCQGETPEKAKYCPACGALLSSDSQAASAGRLVRIPSSEKIAGVCAGIADYLDIDVSLVRALWLAVTIVPGAIVGGVLAYVLAWVMMPTGEPTRPANTRHLTRSSTDVKLAGVCAGLADYLDLDPTLVRVLWILLSVLPGALLGGVVAYLAAWLIGPKAPVLLPQQQPSAA